MKRAHRSLFKRQTAQHQHIREGLRTGDVDLLDESEFDIEQLYRDGRRWWFVFNGVTVSLTSWHLNNQAAFRDTVAAAIGALPPLRAPVNHAFWIKRQMDRSIEKETPT